MIDLEHWLESSMNEMWDLSGGTPWHGPVGGGGSLPAPGPRDAGIGHGRGSSWGTCTVDGNGRRVDPRPSTHPLPLAVLALALGTSRTPPTRGEGFSSQPAVVYPSKGIVNSRDLHGCVIHHIIRRGGKLPTASLNRKLDTPPFLFSPSGRDRPGAGVGGVPRGTTGDLEKGRKYNCQKGEESWEPIPSSPPGERLCNLKRPALVLLGGNVGPCWGAKKGISQRPGCFIWEGS